MASNLKYAVLLERAQLDAITAQLGASALIDIMSGVQPASPDVAVTTQVILATLTCNATFAPGAAGTPGVLTLNAIANGTGTAGASTGTTATWYRLKTAGAVAKIDGTVGISGADMNLNNTSIAQNQTVSITSFTLTNSQ